MPLKSMHACMHVCVNLWIFLVNSMVHGIECSMCCYEIKTVNVCWWIPVQAAVYKEDFETERCDRAGAHSRFEREKEEHKFQLAKLQTQIAAEQAAHEEQIQQYCTKLEMMKAEMDKQKDNHLSIVQFVENDKKHLRDQLEKEKLRNKVNC